MVISNWKLHQRDAQFGRNCESSSYRGRLQFQARTEGYGALGGRTYRPISAQVRPGMEGPVQGLTNISAAGNGSLV